MVRSSLVFALKWALLGLALGLFAFLYNYHMAPIRLPGYEVIAAPAMFSLQFFSHETAFWPKLVIFLSGQYILCFLAMLLVRLATLWFNKSS